MITCGFVHVPNRTHGLFQTNRCSEFHVCFSWPLDSHASVHSHQMLEVPICLMKKNINYKNLNPPSGIKGLFQFKCFFEDSP